MDLKEIMAVNLRRKRHDLQMTQEELAGDVPIAVELRRADVARNECYAALVTWATGLIAMRSW